MSTEKFAVGHGSELHLMAGSMSSRSPLESGDSQNSIRFVSRPKRQYLGNHIDDDVRVAQVMAAVQRLRLSYSKSNVVSEDLSENTRVFIDVTDEVHLDGKVFDGLNDAALLRKLQVPSGIKLKKRSAKCVFKLMSSVLGYNPKTAHGLQDGDQDAVVLVEQDGCHTENLSALSCGLFTVRFHGINLQGMSVSNFGNFLCALKHHGEEVALATLYKIYSKA